MYFRLPGRCSFRRPDSRKALERMASTPSGMVNSSRTGHWLNAYTPMVRSVSGRVTERRLGAAKKAELPTVVTPGVTRTSSTPSRMIRQSPWGLSGRSVMGPVPEMVRSRRERL